MGDIAVPRTVAERPRRSAKPKPVQRPRDQELFWIARQLLRSTTDAERATILLQVPDLVLWQKEEVLSEACRACQFGDGAGYIAVRVAVASANRDEAGQLPAGMAKLLETWRRGMVAIAGGPQ